MANWAVDHLTLTADVSRATHLGARVLDECESVLGVDHPSTLTAGHNLATAYTSAGRLTDAISLYQQTLRGRELGARHPDTLTTRSHLARWQGEAGDPTTAVAALEQLLPDQLRVLGPHHLRTLTTRADLDSWRARAHDQMGRTDPNP